MIGKLISGRYLVESLVGSGGMANVYKAYDNIMGRTVALKVLKEEHREDMEFVRRFEREARAVLSLSHENIVKSYAVGEDGDVSYIVLEYVEGSTLKELIKSDAPLSPKVAVNIACQVLDALSHAHQCGIIHRDVKPQNVIITPRGKAKLTDFGIARDAAATTRTFAGANVIGSVHYISPEQARGDNVTAGTDIYSCGIMLYEMLTGEVPFGGDNSVAIALKHLQEDIIPPVELNPRIPRALSDVIVKATSKNIKTSYLSAHNMNTDLLRALREPHGKFARLENDDGAEARKKRHAGVINISIMLIIVLGLFTAMFFIARAIRDDDGGETTEFIIPTVVGKSIEEGTGLAKLRGFSLIVEEYQSSEEYEEGIILFQEPSPGVAAKEGDTVTVIVSSGNDYVTVPQLVGSYIQDAVNTMGDIDLVLGTPQYITSDLPYGQIIRQEPVAGTDTFAGDIIDIWVSGTPGSSMEMPTVAELNVDIAVALLRQNGFTNIRLKPIAPEKIAAEDSVVSQSPSAGINLASDAVIELGICRTDIGRYAADIAFNLEITTGQADVVATIKLEEGLELVIYETTLSAGQQIPVSFTGYTRKGGEYECIVYVDNERVKNCVVTFTYR